MLFSSIPFLYVFLPCVIILYFLAPKQLKNGCLLAASLVFYAWGEPGFLWIMLAEILCGYGFGLLIGKYRNRAPAGFLLGASLLLDLGLLGYFKYTDFFVGVFGQVSGIPVKLPGIALPIGISFYTFQIISYTIDVYRGTVPAQKNPITLAAYVAMFPQLIAGPIVRYSDVERQLTDRSHSFEKAAAGIRRFILGLGKKVLLANALGELCSTFRGSGDLSAAYYWLYAVSFTLHIYFDFSGYSDMAIGLGKIFGFDFLENFNYPYGSKSITEFWRRWHMSLGGWFRDYVYIPLGGNRVTRGAWLRNILVVWFLTGFWHGAAWNFIAWGLFFAGFLMLEKLAAGGAGKTEKTAGRVEAEDDGAEKTGAGKTGTVASHVYVLLAVTVSFVIFNASDLGQAASDLGCMFGFGGLPLVSRAFFYYLRSYGGIFLLAVLGATPFPKRLAERIQGTGIGGRCLLVLEPLFLAGLLLLVTAYLVDGSFNPFLYFRF